jgi:hypothetical protein
MEDVMDIKRLLLAFGLSAMSLGVMAWTPEEQQQIDEAFDRVELLAQQAQQEKEAQELTQNSLKNAIQSQQKTFEQWNESCDKHHVHGWSNLRKPFRTVLGIGCLPFFLAYTSKREITELAWNALGFAAFPITFSAGLVDDKLNDKCKDATNKASNNDEFQSALGHYNKNLEQLKSLLRNKPESFTEQDKNLLLHVIDQDEKFRNDKISPNFGSIYDPREKLKSEDRLGYDLSFLKELVVNNEKSEKYSDAEGTKLYNEIAGISEKVADTTQEQEMIINGFM